MHWSTCTHLLIDMDGVLWRGDTPLPGLATFFATLRARGLAFRLVTNNSTKTPSQYVAKLAGLGVTVAPAEILTSALATAEYLRRQSPAGGPVYVVGQDGIRQALTDAGFTVLANTTDPITPANAARCVVVGLDRNLTFDRLHEASLHLNAGARLIATNPDTTFPTERGLSFGNGALVALFEAASGQTATVVGKPEPILYDMALAQLNADPATTLVVGDRLNTDIAGAHRAGLASVMLLTGISSRADLAASPVQPTVVLPGLPELTAHLAAA